MAGKANLRELRQIVEQAGLRWVGFTQSKHYHLVVENAKGERMTYHAAVSPSDRRGHLNMRAALRRFADRDCNGAAAEHADLP